MSVNSTKVLRDSFCWILGINGSSFYRYPLNGEIYAKSQLCLYYRCLLFPWVIAKYPSFMVF